MNAPSVTVIPSEPTVNIQMTESQFVNLVRVLIDAPLTSSRENGESVGDYLSTWATVCADLGHSFQAREPIQAEEYWLGD